MVPRSGNALLDAISRREREKFIAACERIEMTLGEPVCQPGDTIRHVYFPVSSYISLITPRGASESLEVGLVGREGSFGLTVLLDVQSSIYIACGLLVYLFIHEGRTPLRE